jgi:hypothetical protein
MAKIYKRSPDGTIALEDGRVPYQVPNPAYLYDLWAPLLGASPLFTYLMLARLARAKITKGIALKKLAMALGGMCDKTLKKHCVILKEMGFIKMRTPNEQERRQGICTIFQILDAPSKVTPAHVKFAQDKSWAPNRKDWEYKPLVEWLIDDEEMVEGQETWDQVEFEADEVCADEDCFEGTTSVNADSQEGNADSQQVNADLSIDSSIDSSIEQSRNRAPRASAMDRQHSLVGGNLTPSGPKKMDGDERSAYSFRFDDPNMPKVGSLVIDVVSKAGKPVSALSKNAVDDLRKAVLLKNGETELSPENMYEKYGDLFSKWVKTLPNVLTDQHSKRLTPGNMVDYIRRYDMVKWGFFAYLQTQHGVEAGTPAGSPKRRSTNAYEARREALGHDGHQ